MNGGTAGPRAQDPAKTGKRQCETAIYEGAGGRFSGSCKRAGLTLAPARSGSGVAEGRRRLRRAVYDGGNEAAS